MKRIRFSLRSLVLLVFLIGGAMGVWWRWDPWVNTRVLEGYESTIHAVRFSPEERKLLTVSTPDMTIISSRSGDFGPGRIHVWNLKSQTPPLVFACGQIFNKGFRSDEFTPDGRWIVSKFGDTNFRTSRARISDANTGKPMFPDDDEALDAVLTANGERIVVVYFKKPAEEREARDGKVLRVLEFPGMKEALRRDGRDSIERYENMPRMGAIICGGGKYVASRTSGEFWNLETGEKWDGAGSLRTLQSCSSDGLHLAGTTTGDDVIAVNLAAGTRELNIPGRPPGHVSPDGRFILTLDLDGLRATVWETSSGKKLWSVDAQPGDRFHYFGASGIEWRGDKLAFLDKNYTTPGYLIDLASGQVRNTTGAPWLFPNGERVLVGFPDSHAEVLESNSMLQRAEFRGHRRIIQCAAMTADGNLVATGSEDKTVRLWSRRRPEQWWGFAVVAEFWIATVSGIALLWSLRRDHHERARKI